MSFSHWKLNGAGSFNINGRMVRESLKAGLELNGEAHLQLFNYTLKAISGKDSEGLANRTSLELAQILEEVQS